MADQSLDQYIAKKNIRVQISNPNFGSNIKGRLGNQNPNGGSFPKVQISNNGSNFKQNVQGQNRPFKVTLNNPGAFDARSKLSTAQTFDARAKIKVKKNTQDARQKIGASAAKTPAAVPGYISDARAKINAKKSNGASLKKNIIRSVPGAKITGSGEIKITLGNSETNLSHPYGNPKIQVKNDLYVPPGQAPPHHMPFSRTIDSFDGDFYKSAEEEIIISPVKRPNFKIEKTLSVKMPEFLGKNFSKTIVNKNETVGPTEVKKFSESIHPAGIKRKAKSVLQIPVRNLEDDEEDDVGNGSPAKEVSGPLKLSGGPLTLRYDDKSDEVSPSKKAKPIEPQVKAATKASSIEVQGIKVMISNLHTIVTQDDIIELFGSIGPMKKAQLVSSGTAEVMYLNREDANQAVAKYHNRELDGQAMQVKIMSTITKSAKSPVLKPVKPDVSPVADKAGPLKLGQSGGKGSDDVELSTLHHALFKTGSGASGPVTFTVKI